MANETPTDTPGHAPLLPATDRRAILAGIGGIAAGALLAGSRTANAGPLTPPPGPITSTHKTLTQVEPRTPINSTNTPGDATATFRITQPGSYYLTGNITGQAAKHGIMITASNVTIDLNGFSLVGVPGAIYGIFVDSTHNNLTIRNGIVSQWPQGGIVIPLGVACIIEHMHASHSAFGILAAAGTVISHCTASSNDSFGFIINPNSTISHCIANQNGEEGFSARSACTFDSCTARMNGSSGFSFWQACTFLNCTSRNNTAAGFSGSGSGAGCILHNCSAMENLGDGYLLASLGTLGSCTAVLNGGNGFTAGNYLHISNCNASLNSLNGIRAEGFNNQVVNNLCSSNGRDPGDGAGILIVGGNSRVEGNNCTSNRRGIDVDGQLNFMTRNTCSNNITNWTIASNNVCLIVYAATSGVITGNSGGLPPGTTDPNANFTY